jgi:hypothetical protein
MSRHPVRNKRPNGLNAFPAKLGRRLRKHNRKPSRCTQTIANLKAEHALELEQAQQAHKLIRS